MKSREITLDEIKITSGLEKSTRIEGVTVLALFLAGFWYLASRK